MNNCVEEEWDVTLYLLQKFKCMFWHVLKVAQENKWYHWISELKLHLINIFFIAFGFLKILLTSGSLMTSQVRSKVKYFTVHGCSMECVITSSKILLLKIIDRASVA